MKNKIKCPTCKITLIPKDKNQWRPFCSERCKLLDLGAWFDGSHHIPGENGMVDGLENDDAPTKH